jgi:hypothetical protein
MGRDHAKDRRTIDLEEEDADVLEDDDPSEDGMG